MPATDLELLIDAARAAGDVARDYAAKGARSWDKPDGGGPVTEADMAVDKLLHDTLCGARPGYGWLSEETEDSDARLVTEQQFIVDPIDGTRAFMAGGTDWAHSIAVVTAGEVTAAVVYLPMRNALFAAAKGQGATLNGAPIALRPVPRVPQVLTARATLEPWHWRDAVVPHLELHFRPSLAYRICLVAAGKFDAMMTLRPCWEWDIAAGALIAAEAGAALSDRRGGAPRFNNARPQVDGLIIASPELHHSYIDRLL